MKIVFCTQNMAPFRMKWMDELAKYHEVVVYHLNQYDSDQNLKYISYKPKQAIIKCESKKVLNKTAYDNTKIIDEKADVYILDGYGFFGQILLILELRKKSIPFIMSIDGGFIKKESILKRNFKKYIVSSAKAYFSTSKETDEFINYYGGNNKKKYRHYFSNITNEYIIDKPLTSEEKTTLRKELDLNDSFIVIAVGKPQHIKGFDLLIQAINNIDNLDLYFIGFNDLNNYSNLINENNKNKIHCINFLNQEELKKYYQAADLLVMPTRGDTWGLVVSEAMANGLCVVTSNKCMAGVAMLDENEIFETECIESITKTINKFMNYTNDVKYNVGITNIEKVKKYSIENSVINDLESLNCIC